MIEITGIRHAWPERAGFVIDRPAGHPHYTFLHFCSSVEILAGGLRQTAPPHACILYAPGTPQFFSSAGPLLHDWFHFTGDLPKGLFDCDTLHMACLLYTSIRLGNSYYHAGAYNEAIAIYETFFTMMKAIFKEDLFPNYHDFDSGDGYIMLARAYLAIKDDNKAMDNVEKSINYYLSLSERTKSNIIDFRSSLITPFVKNSALTLCFDKSLLKQKLLEKLSAESLQPLQNNERYKCLVKKVQEFSF